MSAEPPATEQNEPDIPQPAAQPVEANNHTGEDNGDAEEEEGDEEEDEPKLKYAKLTGSLPNVYRGDSTSAFIVAGDKVVLGTHNGNVHVLQLPGLQPLKTYHAHSATITSISVSPILPPPKPQRSTEERGATTFSPPTSVRSQQPQSTSGQRNARPAQPQVPNTPNNQIYIATSSLDGHVCINSLADPKDVQLRNFARPVSTVALSPDYKNDRTYLSGGLAGQLILTVGGKAGITIDANTNSAAAAATGWLGSIGLGADRGRDQILHSGEGSISAIKWSRTGKWVVWVNEEGIKIMRSHLKLGSEESEDAWRRIAHAAKPNRRVWKDMAGVWKGRCEWIDERHLEADEDLNGVDVAKAANGVNGTDTVKSTASKRVKQVEKLLVGWGDCAWLLHVHEGGKNAAGRPQVGSAEVLHKLQFHDCIVSGIAQYTRTLVAILAYRTRDDDDKPIDQQNDTPKKGRSHRHNGLAPHLRLIRMDATGEEVDLDELSISRFESLSAQDYHLGSLWIPPLPPSLSNAKTGTDNSRGALEGIWDAAGGKYATRMFSSSASVMSRSSSGKEGTLTSPPPSVRGVPPISNRVSEAHPFVEQAGLKLWVVSPYDCVLAIKRDESDRLEWLLERQMYQQAWELIDLKPEVVDPSTAEQKSFASGPSTPSRGARQDGTLADFFADDSRSESTLGPRAHHSIAQKEKRRIADLWLQQLVNADRWEEAGKVAGRVLNTGSRWEHWVLAFAHEGKFDEIMPFIPAARRDDDALGGGILVPSLVYEVVLGHYISTDPPVVGDLLEKWEPEAFDARSVIDAIESRLNSGELQVDGQDWRILMEALGRLYLADGRAQDALRCWIRTQNADKAMDLIREEKLVDVVASEDVTGLLMLRVTKDMLRDAPIDELDSASSEVIALLVEEALRGTVMPETIIHQLQQKGKTFRLFTFFYLRALWNASSTTSTTQLQAPRRGKFYRRIEEEGHALVEDHADLAVDLFSTYDRPLLMTFLRTSTVYSYDRAASICETRHFIPELVYILSKTGQTKRALFLIIGELGDVKQAIEFAKENPDLWDDLLDYSMDKPRFIRGLLEEVGTAIDPIELVRRIPEGLEIEGLKEGVQRMLRAYDVQFSLSEGAAKVLRGEVVGGMDTLRAGRRKGVRFELVHENAEDVELAVHDPPTRVEGGEAIPVPKKKAQKHEVRQQGVKPGHCVGCGEAFHEEGTFAFPPSASLPKPMHYPSPPSTTDLKINRKRTPPRLRLRPRLPPLLPPPLRRGTLFREGDLPPVVAAGLWR